MWKEPLVALNAPEDKDPEMYAYISCVNYLINKVILIKFPLEGVEQDDGNGTVILYHLPNSLRGSEI